MLYTIAHVLRDRVPVLWDMVDGLNGWLFGMRYGRRLKAVEAEVLRRYEAETGMKILHMREVDTHRLVEFFGEQPEEAFTYFRPHGFDEMSLRKLQKNRSFLAYVLMDEDEDENEDENEDEKIAGYCFLRSFFMGKGFRGRMVGMSHRGNGLGTMMNCMMNEVGFGIGLRLFETVSKRNIASYRSALSASEVRVMEEMENDELYLEIINL